MSAQELRYSSVNELPADAAQALLRFGLALADTKHFLGRRLSEWVTAAPAMEASVAAAAITQDELGHARSLLAMLRDVSGAPEELNPETDMSRSTFYAPAALHKSWESWNDVMANMLLLDRALTMIFDAAAQCELAPLRQRVAKIRQEERFHRIFTEGWVARLAQNERSRAALQQAIAAHWPVAEAWFGPKNEATGTALVQAGLLAKHPHELAEAWRQSLEDFLKKHAISIPSANISWDNWRKETRDGGYEN